MRTRTWLAAPLAALALVGCIPPGGPPDDQTNQHRQDPNPRQPRPELCDFSITVAWRFVIGGNDKGETVFWIVSPWGTDNGKGKRSASARHFTHKGAYCNQHVRVQVTSITGNGPGIVGCVAQNDSRPRQRPAVDEGRSQRESAVCVLN